MHIKLVQFIFTQDVHDLCNTVHNVIIAIDIQQSNITSPFTLVDLSGIEPKRRRTCLALSWLCSDENVHCNVVVKINQFSD